MPSNPGADDTPYAADAADLAAHRDGLAAILNARWEAGAAAARLVAAEPPPGAIRWSRPAFDRLKAHRGDAALAAAVTEAQAKLSRSAKSYPEVAEGLRRAPLSGHFALLYRIVLTIEDTERVEVTALTGG
ncbi:MAG: hypothetical protein OHK0024_07740 [Thalassobaculales bacterium]